MKTSEFDKRIAALGFLVETDAYGEKSVFTDIDYKDPFMIIGVTAVGKTVLMNYPNRRYTVMTETEEQLNCPYCHYHHGIQMLIRGEHQCTSIMPRTHYKLGTHNFSSKETDMVSIHYCPMCGRKLSETDDQKR